MPHLWFVPLLEWRYGFIDGLVAIGPLTRACTLHGSNESNDSMHRIFGILDLKLPAGGYSVLVEIEGQRGGMMKKIGLIGGTSWESTVTYYQLLNRLVNKELGGSHSAQCILYSVDFEDIETNVYANQWGKIADILVEAATSLEKAGADFIVICTNTLHKLVPEIESRINIPILHIAEATADAIEAAGIRKVGLLGTAPTMTQDFYKSRLIKRGLEVVIPEASDITTVDKIIFDELCHGIVKDESKQEYLRIITDMERSGAQGIILGCTEIDLLVKQDDIAVPVFDTTQIHASVAVQKALER